ncbi:MAG: hypothetical protein ABSD57_09600 [Verrucomicrobiota bacterium]|jgi:uncharacterized membrane protein YfcA
MKKLIQMCFLFGLVLSATAQDSQTLNIVDATNGTDSGFFTNKTASQGWWSAKQGGMIGGIGGSVIGCFGGLLGCLAGRGKARRFVLAMTKIFIVLGSLLTIAGLAAVALKQPYAVWYVLLLPGIILTSVFGATLRSIQRRYDDLEIRRMASIDAMRS